MTSQNIFSQYFGILIKGQTYLNLLYLILYFPLGLVYFIFIVVALSLGAGLLIVWIGLLFWLLLFAGAWVFAALERQLAISILKVEIPNSPNRPKVNGTVWHKFVDHISNVSTWKELLYLFLKFPLGILFFTLTVTFISVSLAFILAPALYPLASYNLGFTVVDSALTAALVSLTGLLILPGFMHILNFCAKLAGSFAVVMLSQPSDIPPSMSEVPSSKTSMEK